MATSAILDQVLLELRHSDVVDEFTKTKDKKINRH